MITRLLSGIVFVLLALAGRSQDSTEITNPKLMVAYARNVAAKAAVLERKLDEKSEKALKAMKKLEARMKRRLGKTDSMAAKEIFAGADDKYRALQEKLKDSQLKEYIPQLDSMKTALQFLQNSNMPGAAGKLKEAMVKLKELEGQWAKAENIKAFIKERKEFLKQQLSKFGLGKELKKLNKTFYYYSEQLKEYKVLLKDEKKMERKAIELLSKTKWWKDFFRKNSQLATLFRLPDPNEPLSMANMAGLQTRASVNNLIQQQINAAGPGGMQQFRDNVQAAQAQLRDLKNKILKSGGGSSDDELPDFKPNGQKTKSFLQRLEFGTNIQSQKANSFFPVTTDIGISLGYKLNDKSIIGLGANYKAGLGRGWNAIRLTHEGMGLRSFVDYKVKKSFWLSGGFEMQYRAGFARVDQLRDYSAWQRSGLLGVSKVVNVKSKFFKKTKVSLLWDFLSYEQVPRVQPVLVRFNYGF